MVEVGVLVVAVDLLDGDGLVDVSVEVSVVGGGVVVARLELGIEGCVSGVVIPLGGVCTSCKVDEGGLGIVVAIILEGDGLSGNVEGNRL